MIKKNYLLFLVFALQFVYVNANDIYKELKKKIQNHNIKMMALYFPQFYEFEENNYLWGKGFTEWTLINNYQGDIKKPHPDIGQYNMLNKATREKQAYIAKEHGIDAFCYYHYWFKDKKVMYAGVEKILEDGQPNLPFTFCWANEPWTRNWDGLESETLIAQEYGTKEDWISHYHYLLKFFKHPNYIKENNCPILYIYRIEHIIQNNALEMFKLWKELIKKDGFDDLKIVSILGGFETMLDIKYIDGYAEHQPNFNGGKAGNTLLFINDKQYNLDAKKIYQSILTNKKIHPNYTRGIFFGWDNSSRRINKTSYKITNATYNDFEDLLFKTIENIIKEPNKDSNFILINAWNEWSEQAILEPNTHDGYSVLKIIKKFFA